MSRKQQSYPLAFRDVDYRNRLEPAEIVAALRAIARESKALL